MLDIKFIRENKDLIADASKKKFLAFDVEELLKTDDFRREKLLSIEKKRTLQNSFNDKITKAETPEERQKLIDEMRILKSDLNKEEEELKALVKKWQMLMVAVPNIPDMSVPVGATDAENLEVKTWGEIPKFDFTPKNHVELMESLDMVDLHRGTKVAGFRGYFLKNDGALLNFAIWQFVIDQFREKADFIPMIVPSIVTRQTLLGSGYLPQGEEDLYKTQDDTFLAGTSEVATMSYHADEVLDKKDLPKKFFSFSPAFRREAGSHGKDTKGIFRVHEFYKFEQVVLCEASHSESVKHHEALLENVEVLMQKLAIPYHVVLNCSGDLGLGQVKKYDVEAWVPSEQKYRETHSCSYFHDFQTRRLNIRYKDEEGKMRFAHSLNNTAVASPRILVSILENNQQADGSIRIPDALQKYIGKEFISAVKK